MGKVGTGGGKTKWSWGDWGGVKKSMCAPSRERKGGKEGRDKRGKNIKIGKS